MQSWYLASCYLSTVRVARGRTDVSRPLQHDCYIVLRARYAEAFFQRRHNWIVEKMQPFRLQIMGRVVELRGCVVAGHKIKDALAERMVMKKLFVVMILTMLVVGSTGCRNGLFRTRGAKCRSDAGQSSHFCLPGMRQSQPAPPPTYAPAPVCEPVCGEVNYVSDECCPEGGTSYQGFPTTPMDGSQVMHSPVYSDEIVQGYSEGTVYTGSPTAAPYTVPGPESAPMPPVN